MKNKLLLIAAMAFTFFQSTAQTNGHFSFTWTMIEDGAEWKRNVDVYSSASNFAVFSDDRETGSERVVINRSGKNGIEFYSDIISETERDNYYSNFSWEESLIDAPYVSQIFEGVMSMPDFNDGFQLLPEKSDIAGLPCQKFKITLPDNEGEITGWIALGVHCNISGDYFFLDTDKGMILELTMNFADNILEVKCLAYEPKFPESSPVYSMEIPVGYTPLTDMEEEDYYDDEESGND